MINSIYQALTNRKKSGTWERKADSDIQSMQNSFKNAGFSAVLPVIVYIISFIILYVAFKKSTDNRILYCLLLSPIPFFITYLLQIIKGRSFVWSTDVKICNNCMKKSRTDSKECKCGGEFEPLDFYEFIDKDQRLN